MKDNEQILGVREAAILLGIGPKKLRSWTKSRVIPFMAYPGGILKFQRDDLVRWMESKTFVPKSCETPDEREKRIASEKRQKAAKALSEKQLKRHYPNGIPQ